MILNSRSIAFTLSLLTAGLGTAAVAHASVIGMTGNLQLFSTTGSNVADSSDDGLIHIWLDQQHYALPSDTVLDSDLTDPTQRYVIASARDRETRAYIGRGSTLPTGSLVDVYLASYDPENHRGASGSVTFSSPVAGIIAGGLLFHISDFAVSNDASYARGESSSGEGLENSDWVQLSPDRMTLTLNAKSANQLAILTAPTDASSAPEPATLALCGLSLLALATIRKTAQRPR